MMAYNSNIFNKYINDYDPYTVIVPFHITRDVSIAKYTFRCGTLFSYIGNGQIKAELNIRSLNNLFKTETQIIDPKKEFSWEPYEFINHVRGLSNLPNFVFPSSVGSTHVAPVTLPISATMTSEGPGKTIKKSKQTAPSTRVIPQIKKVYCPYNLDVIVYDVNNNRIDELCGELTRDLFFGIMKHLTEKTVFDGFEYFKEGVFDLGLFQKTNEMENDDFAALDVMKSIAIPTYIA